jgi:hypothetical protein
MKLFDRLRPGPGCPGPRYGLLVILALGAAMLAAAACGGSGGTPDTTGQGGGATPIQVLTPVVRADLVQSVTGSAKLVASKGKTAVVAQVPQASVSAVAPGQAATVAFFTPPAGGRSGAPMPQGGQSGAPFPQGAPSGAPMPQGAPSGAPMPQGGPSGAPFPQGGQGGFGGDASRDRGTPGTVTAVKTNADGSAAVTITLEKAPEGATPTSVGFATIETRILAADVIVIPTAAITGSGESATVQVVSGGKTSTRPIVIGQQAGAQSEVVSGLSVGENVLWTRSFPSDGSLGASAGPFPGQAQQ